MAVPLKRKRFTPAEYYALERNAEYKSDYYEGEIFDMSGGTSTHSLIAANITGELRQRLKGKPCRAYESNLRLKVSATGLRTYPDASVYCGPLEFDAEDPGETTALNPTVAFEVLSPSTEAYDRGAKAESYRLIETLKVYVLVSKDAPRAEVYDRSGGGAWSLRDVRGLDAAITLECIGVSLPLSEVYSGVEFPTPPAKPRLQN